MVVHALLTTFVCLNFAVCINAYGLESTVQKGLAHIVCILLDTIVQFFYVLFCNIRLLAVAKQKKVHIKSTSAVRFSHNLTLHNSFLIYLQNQLHFYIHGNMYDLTCGKKNQIIDSQQLWNCSKKCTHHLPTTKEEKQKSA